MQAAGVIERVKWERGQRIRGLGRGRPTDVPPPGPVTPGTIRILARSVDQPGARELAPEDLERSIAAGDLVWIDIVPGTATEMLLDTRLHLGPLTIEDCLVPLRMPKLDPLPGGGAFVAVFPVRLVEGFEPRLRMSAVPIVVGPRYIVTVQREPTLELSLRLEAAFNGDIPLVEPSGAALAHLAVDALVDRHLPVMLRTAEVAEELEERLNPQSERDSLDALDRLIILRRISLPSGAWALPSKRCWAVSAGCTLPSGRISRMLLITSKRLSTRSRQPVITSTAQSRDTGCEGMHALRTAFGG
jgi:hypothetical protein